MFGYANNPVKYNDPTGEISMPAFADAQKAMRVVSGATGVISSTVPIATTLITEEGQE